MLINNRISPSSSNGSNSISMLSNVGYDYSFNVIDNQKDISSILFSDTVKRVISNGILSTYNLHYTPFFKEIDKKQKTFTYYNKNICKGKVGNDNLIASIDITFTKHTSRTNNIPLDDSLRDYKQATGIWVTEFYLEDIHSVLWLDKKLTEHLLSFTYFNVNLPSADYSIVFYPDFINKSVTAWIVTFTEYPVSNATFTGKFIYRYYNTKPIIETDNAFTIINVTEFNNDTLDIVFDLHTYSTEYAIYKNYISNDNIECILKTFNYSIDSYDTYITNYYFPINHNGIGFSSDTQLLYINILSRDKLISKINFTLKESPLYYTIFDNKVKDDISNKSEQIEFVIKYDGQKTIKFDKNNMYIIKNVRILSLDNKGENCYAVSYDPLTSTIDINTTISSSYIKIVMQLEFSNMFLDFYTYNDNGVIIKDFSINNGNLLLYYILGFNINNNVIISTKIRIDKITPETISGFDYIISGSVKLPYKSTAQDTRFVGSVEHENAIGSKPYDIQYLPSNLIKIYKDSSTLQKYMDMLYFDNDQNSKSFTEIVNTMTPFYHLSSVFDSSVLDKDITVENEVIYLSDMIIVKLDVTDYDNTQLLFIECYSNKEAFTNVIDFGDNMYRLDSLNPRLFKDSTLIKTKKRNFVFGFIPLLANQLDSANPKIVLNMGYMDSIFGFKGKVQKVEIDFNTAGYGALHYNDEVYNNV